MFPPAERLALFAGLVSATNGGMFALDEVSAATGLSVLPVLAGRADILKLIKRHLGVGSETVDGLVAAAGEEEESVELLSDIETDGSELSDHSVRAVLR